MTVSTGEIRRLREAGVLTVRRVSMLTAATCEDEKKIYLAQQQKIG
jgi:hypothetical protein